MKRLGLALAFCLLAQSAWAQCTGVFPANTLCGNLTGAARPPGAFSASGSIIGPASSTAGGLPKWGNSSGTQLIDAAGTTILGNYTWGGNNTFASPTNFTGTFQVGGATKTFPAGAVTLGGLSTTQTWTGANSFTGIISTTGNVYMNSGMPWCDVRGTGAVGDGVADDSGAFNTCITRITTGSLSGFGGGGVIYVPPGNYCLASGISITGAANDVKIIGAGYRFSAIQACGHNVTTLTLDRQNITVENLQIYGFGMGTTDTVGTQTKPALHLTTGCSFCRIDHVGVAGGSAAMLIEAAGANIINVTGSFGYGDGAGANAILYAKNAGSWVFGSAFDQVYPVSQPAHPTAAPTAWISAHAYPLGSLALFTCNSRSYVYQTSVSGTSGSGAQPTCKPYGQAVVDNSATWQLVRPATYYCAQIDTGVNEMHFTNTDFTCASTANFAMTNTLSAGSPQAVALQGVTFGAASIANVRLTAGSNFSLQGSETSFCVENGCAAVLVDSTWSGPALIQNNRFLNFMSYGLLMNGGQRLNFSGNHITSADTRSILISPTTSTSYTFNVVNNIMDTTGISITANVGGGSRYAVFGNNCNGTGFTDSGSGTKYVPAGSNCF